LRAAASAAIDFGIATIGATTATPSITVPGELRDQIRLAARLGISLDTVFRRCLAGYLVLGDHIRQISDDDSLSRQMQVAVDRGQAVTFDRLLTVLGEDYRREQAVGAEPRGIGALRAELVKGVLAGELVDSTSLDYDLDAHHLGLIAEGSGVESAVRSLGTTLDRTVLMVQGSENQVWAWLGGRSGTHPSRIEEATEFLEGCGQVFALGEPGDGLPGWRLTHRQAQAALSVARRRKASVVRYSDVALHAAALQDDLLSTSLRRLYLDPLETSRNGSALRETVRAFLAAGQNHTSAAAALGVNRGTVTYRLEAVEDLLGRSISSCLAGLAAALELREPDSRT